MKHTKSTITAIKKLRVKKLHPKEIQERNKRIFDKSYFGLLLAEQRKHISGM